MTDREMVELKIKCLELTKGDNTRSIDEWIAVAKKLLCFLVEKNENVGLNEVVIDQKKQQKIQEKQRKIREFFSDIPPGQSTANSCHQDFSVQPGQIQQEQMKESHY